MKMSVKHKSFEDCCPVLSLGDGTAMTRRGEVVVGMEVELPTLLTLRPSDYDALVAGICSAVGLLPVWTVVHKQDFFVRREFSYDDSEFDGIRSSGGDPFLREAYLKTFSGRVFLEHRCNIYLVFSSQKVVLGQSGRGSLFDRILPRRSAGEKVEGCRRMAGEFAAVLSQRCGFGVRVFDSESDWLAPGGGSGVLNAYFTLGAGGPVVEDPVNEPGQVRVGDRVVRFLALTTSEQLRGDVDVCREAAEFSSPGSKMYVSQGSMYGPFLSCEHVLNQYFVSLESKDVEQMLTKRREWMLRFAEQDSGNSVGAEELGTFMREGLSGSDKVVLSHLNLMYWADGSEIDRVQSEVVACLGSGLFGAAAATQDAPVLFWSGCPGGGAELSEDNWLLQPLPPVACLGSFETFDKGLGVGDYMFTDRFSKRPVRMDFGWKAEAAGLLESYNMFVNGRTGTGKSFLTNHLLTNRYERGEMVMVLDIGHSYVGSARLIREHSGGKDGVYMTWDEQHRVSFSLFDDVRQWVKEGGKLNMNNLSVVHFVNVLRVCWEPEGGWKPAQEAVLNQIVEAFVNWCLAGGRVKPSFDDFVAFVSDDVLPRIRFVAKKTELVDGQIVDRSVAEVEREERENGFFFGAVRVTPSLFDVEAFLTSIQVYSSGYAYGDLFRANDDVDLFGSRFSVLDVSYLQSIGGTYYSVCILNLMRMMEKKMMSVEGFKTIVIEEAWSSLANKVMADYLGNLFRTARKFYTSITVVTQLIEDVVNNPYVGRAIFDNCPIRILLDQSAQAAQFARLAEMLSLSETETAQVLSMGGKSLGKARPFFVQVFSKRNFCGVYYTEVSRRQALVFESNVEKKRPLWDLADRLEAEGVAQPFHEAVRRFENG